MKCLTILLLVAVCATSTLAQFGDPSGLSAASKAYREYRLTNTNPNYGFAKVQALIKHIKPDSTDNSVLSANTFAKLSVPEKFTYCMLHGEVFAQNCDGMPGIIDEEKKFFANLPNPFGEEVWSDRQTSFLDSNRSAVIKMIRATMKAHNRVGLNLKQAIVQVDALELIPDLVSIYNSAHKDQDILTVFCILMKDGKFKPFLVSQTYAKLYGDKSSYKSFMVANTANQKLTIARAMAYYKSRKS